MRAAAAAMSVVLGLGFGLPCVFGLLHLARTGEVWTFMGFPTYSGPFERVGLPTSVPLLAAFLVVCVAEVVVGVLLFADAPHASVAAHVLLVPEMVFWAGFALPFGPPVGIARSVLLLLA